MSEENNLNSINQENSEMPQSEERQNNWEDYVRTYLSDIFARRFGPLKPEFERLQSSINEIKRVLNEKVDGKLDVEESAELRDFVLHWVNQQTDKAQQEMSWAVDEARREAAEQTREEAGQEFQAQLEKAKSEWEVSAREANEMSFQKRLEQACAEAAVVARRESETQLEDLREQLEASRKALTLAVSSAQSASLQAANFDLLRSAVDDVDAQRTQSETLTSLVKRAGQFAPRIVFFVVKGGDAVGWKASGFENGLNDETVRLLTVPTANPTLLNEALMGFRTATGKSSSPGENSAVLGLYGSPAPERALAVPLVVRGKAAAVLYADSGTQSESSINTAAIETLMRVASMGIELLPTRRGVEPPRVAPAPAAAPQKPVSTTYPGDSSATAVAPKPVKAPESPAPPTPIVKSKVEPPAVERPEPVEPPSPISTLPAPEVVVDARTTDDLTMPSSVAESLREAEAQAPQPWQIESEPAIKPIGPIAKTLTDEPDPAPSFSPSSLTTEVPTTNDYGEVKEVREDLAESEPPPPLKVSSPVIEWKASAPTIPITKPRQTLDLPPEPVTPPVVEDRPAASAFNPSPAFSPAPEPPRPLQNLVAVPAPASETEQRAHNDARRFARLLVSEIKLYNAAKVNEGRRNFDLYERLKDEIDRSRKVYDKRVSPAVATRFDYFYDELVQTLAEGDPAKLGPACPGPFVLAS